MFYRHIFGSSFVSGGHELPEWCNRATINFGVKDNILSPAVTKGCLLEDRGAHYPPHWMELQTTPSRDSWSQVLFSIRVIPKPGFEKGTKQAREPGRRGPPKTLPVSSTCRYVRSHLDHSKTLQNHFTCNPLKPCLKKERSQLAAAPTTKEIQKVV